MLGFRLEGFRVYGFRCLMVQGVNLTGCRVADAGFPGSLDMPPVACRVCCLVPYLFVFGGLRVSWTSFRKVVGQGQLGLQGCEYAVLFQPLRF